MDQERTAWSRDDWEQEYAAIGATSETEAEAILVREAADLKPGRALDLGCGMGTNALWLAEQGWDVTAIDWAETAISAAKAAAVQRGLSASFQVADVTEWTPDSAFDLVISTYALPVGRESQDRALQAAKQALAPGGILLVVEWERSSASAAAFDPSELVSLDELTESLAGLTIEKAEVVAVDLQAHARREGREIDENGKPAHGHSHHGHDTGDWLAACVRARR